MRILFMGTPDFAVASLDALINAKHKICGVFTQPDKPKNRGHKLMPSPVKLCAAEHGIDVFQPKTLRDPEIVKTISALEPEMIAVAAYGKILPEEILQIPKYGCINVHSSLLPMYRGAAPINWAILSGDTESGVTIMYMAKELDAGDIILQRRTQIEPQEDAEHLTRRLAVLGAETLTEAVSLIAAGKAVRTPQDNSKATYAPLLTRDMSPVDWTLSAHEINCRIRALIPWPCASTDVIGTETLKLYASVETQEHTSCAPGSVTDVGKSGIGIACGDGLILRITELSAPNKKRMAAASYALGHKIL